MFAQSGNSGAGFGFPPGGTTQKKSVWPKVLIVLLVAGLVGGYLYWYLTGESEGGEPGAACVLVIDRSASSAADNTTEQYRSMVDRAVEGCAEADAVLSAYYFDSSTSGPERIGEYELYEPAGRVASKRESQQEAAVEDAQDEIAAVFEEDSSDDGRGDILAAYNAAADELAQQAASEDTIDEVYLVLITDGLQLSSGVSVERLADPAASADDLVAVAEDINAVPAVSGVLVTFGGVGEGVNADGEPLDDAFEAEVEEFWRLLTEAGGGQVCTYSNDPGVVPGSC